MLNIISKILATTFFGCFLFIVTTSNASAQACIVGYTGGTQAAGCKICTGASSYCCQTNQNRGCTCDAGSCSCQVDTDYCKEAGQPASGSQTCECVSSGNSCSDNSSCGGGFGLHNGEYQYDYCDCTLIASNCTSEPGKATLYCGYEGGPTSTPQPDPTDVPEPTATPVPPTPTNTPTPTPTNTPTPTPTPVIVGNIYYDNDDGTIQVVGGMCTRIGLSPTGQVVTDAAVTATKDSSGVVSNGTIIGSAFSIVTDLVKGATDYTVRLILPTPAPGQAVSYTCGCPLVSGQEYICEYSGVGADDTVSFFVKENNLADPWWQAVGGNIYARNQVRSKVPVATCDADATCESGIITGPTNANYGGFIAVGEGGSVITTKDNSDAYVHSAGSRTTALGAYGTGVRPSTENYSYFFGNVNRDLVTVANLTALKAAIDAQAADSTGLYLYGGGGTLTIDKTDGTVPLSIPADKKVIVFIPGSLQFSNSSGLDEAVITSVANGGFLMFVVQNNITIDAAVGYVDSTTLSSATPNLTGVFAADGQITVASDNNASTTDRKFIGAGTFVGLDTANTGNGINLLRNFDDGDLGKTKNSVDPAEVFVFRPDFVDNYPTEMKTAQYNWKELAPQR